MLHMHSWKPNTSILVGLHDFGKCSRAHGVVVSHPLRMRRALSSNPSVSTLPPRKKVGMSFAPGHQAKMSLNVEDAVPLKKLTLDSYRE